MAALATRTRTSPGPGSGTGRSSLKSAPPASARSNWTPCMNRRFYGGGVNLAPEGSGAKDGFAGGSSGQGGANGKTRDSQR